VTVLIPPLSVRSCRSVLGALALLIGAALPVTAFAEEQSDTSTQDKRVFSEKVREGLVKFGPLQSEGKWSDALVLVDELLKLALPGTYDEYYLTYVKGQIYLRLDKPDDAIAPIEKALRLSDQAAPPHFLDPRDERGMLRTLAQLYYAQGSVKGINSIKQDQAFAKAIAYLGRLIQEERAEHNVSSDDILFCATLIYNRAQLPSKPDVALLKDAQKMCEDGLLLSVSSKNDTQFYRLLLGSLIAQDDYARAAEIIELQVRQDPSGKQNKDNWSQLTAIYLNLGQDDKDKRKQFEYNLRAIVTMERAQAIGLMKTPKDNFQLVSTYYNIGQTERAAELLETDLKNGTVDPDQKYWLYVAQWYQLLNKDEKAIEVLKEAGRHYPNSGEFDFLAAQNYYALEKFEEALQEAKVAATKGLGEKTWQAWSFLAYTAFELHRYDEALEAVTKAMTFPGSERDKQLPNFRKAVEKAIEDRKAQDEALKAKQQL
jgi:tetratricopeptide (TPR) repeat protein